MQMKRQWAEWGINNLNDEIRNLKFEVRIWEVRLAFQVAHLSESGFSGL